MRDIKKCVVCGESFPIAHSSHKICSVECRKKQRNSFSKHGPSFCLYCGDKFQKRTGNHFYCDRLCNDKHRRELLPDKITYSETKENIIKRDNGSCVVCGETYNLRVHHKEPLIFDGTSDDDNLETLCNMCHRKKHKDIDDMRAERRQTALAAPV